MCVRVSTMAPNALQTIPGRRGYFSYYFLANSGSFFLPSGGQGGVINKWPVEPFETVPVIKGDTNKVELNCCCIQRRPFLLSLTRLFGLI